MTALLGAYQHGRTGSIPGILIDLSSGKSPIGNRPKYWFHKPISTFDPLKQQKADPYGLHVHALRFQFQKEQIFLVNQFVHTLRFKIQYLIKCSFFWTDIFVYLVE